MKIWVFIIVFLATAMSVSASLLDDLRAYYSLDELSGSAVDSANGYDSYENSPVGSYTGLINGSRGTFTSTSNYFYNCSFPLSNIQNYSVNVWLNETRNGGIISLGRYFSTDIFLTMEGESGSYKVTMDGTNIIIGSIVGGTWTMFTLVFNNTDDKMYAYINGNFTGISSALTLSGVSDDYPRLFIGIDRSDVCGDTADGAYNNYDGGYIDEVGIWNRTLTNAEVNTLYNGGAGFAYPFSESCVESWSPQYSAVCDGVSASRTLTYFDANSCNTSISLPADNGSIFSCPLYGGFDGVTSNLSNLNNSVLESFSGLVLEKTPFGLIRWNNIVNLSSANFVVNVLFNLRNVFVNAGSLHSSLNSSANVSLYNVSFVNPIVLKDGVVCSDCVRNSFVGGVLNFSVSGFSNYSLDENATPSIVFVSPSDSGVVSRDYVMVNVSVNTNVSSINISLYNTTGLISVINGSFANFTNLSNGQYFYNATACNLYNTCNDSEIVSVSVNVPIVPDSVTNLLNLSATNDSIFWSWSNPVLFNYSMLFLDGVNFVNSTGSSYNVSGLSPNTSYTLTVHTVLDGVVNDTNVSSTARTLENVSVVVDGVVPAINFTAPTIENNSVVSDVAYFDVRVVASDVNFANLSLFVYNGNHVLVQNYSTTLTVIARRITVSANGVYYFNATACDLYGNCNSTELRTVSVLGVGYSPAIGATGGASGSILANCVSPYYWNGLSCVKQDVGTNAEVVVSLLSVDNVLNLEDNPVLSYNVSYFRDNVLASASSHYADILDVNGSIVKTVELSVLTSGVYGFSNDFTEFPEQTYTVRNVLDGSQNLITANVVAYPPMLGLIYDGGLLSVSKVVVVVILFCFITFLSVIGFSALFKK